MQGAQSAFEWVCPLATSRHAYKPVALFFSAFCCVFLALMFVAFTIVGRQKTPGAAAGSLSDMASEHSVAAETCSGLRAIDHAGSKPSIEQRREARRTGKFLRLRVCCLPLGRSWMKVKEAI